MRYEFTNEATKKLLGLDSNTIGRITKGILELPKKGDVKPMQGFSDGRLRLRIGKYRIVFMNISKNKELYEVCIIDIDTRGDIYK